MATIHEEMIIAATPDAVWDAVRDFGALHTRLVPGFVVATTIDNAAVWTVRVVTFATGAVLRERIVAVDDGRRRLVWAIDDATVEHHNGAIEVRAHGDGSRVIWTADVLPDTLAAQFQPLMAAGLATMSAHLGKPGAT